MRGAVFIETFKQTWLHMLYWGMGLAAFGLLVALMVPLFDIQQFAELMETLPPFMLGALGVGNDPSVIGTVEGFVAIGFFGKFALIFAVYPVVMGMRVSSNEEDNGTLDMVLSTPVQRSTYIIERFLAYAVSIVGVVVMIYIGMSVGVVVGNVDIDMGALSSLIWNLIPILIFVLALTILVGSFIRRRKRALEIMTAYVIISFVIQTVASMATDTALESIGVISFFTYYNAPDILSNGIVPLHVFGLTALTVIFLVGSMYFFERRDIGL